MSQILDDLKGLKESGGSHSGEVLYESSEVRFYDSYAEFIRNRYPYFKVRYFEIESFKIKSGYLLKNRWLLIVVALVVIVFCIKIMTDLVFACLESPTLSFFFHRGAFLAFWGPLMLLCLSVIVIFSTRKKTRWVRLVVKGKRVDRRITEIHERGECKELEMFLSKRIGK